MAIRHIQVYLTELYTDDTEKTSTAAWQKPFFVICFGPEPLADGMAVCYNTPNSEVLEMVKILFVCHGNICRSPMAEYVMKDLVRKAGRASDFEIASAAVSREELGNPVYPPARRELARHGIACDGHAAHQITAREYARYDRVYYMDRSNARYLQRLLPDVEKCRPLLERDVADPWYTGDFTQTWNDVVEGCTRILEEFA